MESHKKERNGLRFFKQSSLAVLFLIILPLILTSGQRAGEAMDSHLQLPDDMGNAVPSEFKQDPLMALLGAPFEEIVQVLGEPDEQGYDEWNGPHKYILFRRANGTIRFCSPEPMREKIAVSIIVEPGQEVLGVRVGMHFNEIRTILGPPDFGPELGMDNRHYMDYFFGEMGDGVPKILVSFSAASNDHPTDLVFIKWEGFDYSQMELSQDGGQSISTRTDSESLIDHVQPSQP